MATVLNVPTTTIQVGSKTFGPFPVPTGTTDAQITLDRTASLNSQPATVVLTAEFQFSQDGGTTWTPLGQYDFTTVGGTIVYNGQTVTTSSYGFSPMPGSPTNANRQVQVTIVVQGQPITTSGTITLS